MGLRVKVRMSKIVVTQIKVDVQVRRLSNPDFLEIF